MFSKSTTFRKSAIAISTLLCMAGAANATDPGTGGSSYFVTGSDSDTSVVQNLFRDISGGAALLVTGDDATSGGVSIGMETRVFGETFDTLNFSTNGFISTDPGDGSDLGNDASLPAGIQSGDRIYLHHDDTEAEIYGGYFSSKNSGFGTEAFIAQFDACHFNCTPGVDLTVQYNAIILRDGTVIVAHELAGSEEGSSATVGIQNAEATQGHAYSANEAGSITDGLTNIFIPDENGISDDLTIIAAEQGIVTTSMIGGNIANHAFGALGGNTVGGSTSGSSEITPYANGNLWFAGLASYSTGSYGSDFDMERFGGQVGVDVYRTNNAIFGISGAYTNGSASSGKASVDIESWSIAPYASFIGNFGWIYSANAEYTVTDYTNYNLPFLTNLEAQGRKWAVHLEATKDYSAGNGMIFTPRLAFSAGNEVFDHWKSSGGMTRAVEDASFYKTELTGKLSKQFAWGGGSGTGHLLFGANYISTSGDDDIALYSTNYADTRFSGIAGAGVDFQSGNRTVSLGARASGLGSGVTSYTGTLKVSVAF